MSSMPKYQRFIGRLLTQTLVVSLSLSMTFGGFGFSVQSAQASSPQEVKAADAEYKSAKEELTSQQNELKEKRNELKALQRSQDDGDNSGCNLCRPRCSAGCTDEFLATLSFGKDERQMRAVLSGNVDSCQMIYDEKGESIPSACKAQVVKCASVAKARKIKQLEKDIQLLTDSIKDQKKEVSEKLRAYTEASGDCADCALEAQKAQMQAMFPKPSTGELIVAGIGAATPLLMGGLSAYMGIRGMNQYASMYNNYLGTCSTMGIPCTAPGMGGMGGMGAYGMMGGMGGYGMMGLGLAGMGLAGLNVGGFAGINAGAFTGMYPGMGGFGGALSGMYPGMAGFGGFGGAFAGINAGAFSGMYPGMGGFGGAFSGMYPGMAGFGGFGGALAGINAGAFSGMYPGMGGFGAFSGMYPGMGGFGGALSGMYPGMAGFGGFGGAFAGVNAGAFSGMYPGMGGFGGFNGMYPGMGGFAGINAGAFTGMSPGMGGFSGFYGMSPGMGGFAGVNAGAFTGSLYPSSPLTAGWATPNFGYGQGFNSALSPFGNSQYGGLYNSSMQYAMQQAQRQQSDLMLAQQQSWEAQQRVSQIMGAGYGGGYGYGGIGYGNIGGSFGIGASGYMGYGLGSGAGMRSF